MLSQKEINSLKKQIGEVRENLRLINERESEYVVPTEIPLQLKKDKQRVETQLKQLETELAQVKSILLGPFLPPSPPERFTGRNEILYELTTALINQNKRAIIALQGMGGVGKTALAQQLAALLRSHFAGGIFWANLPDTNGDAISILQNWNRALSGDPASKQDPTSLANRTQLLLENHQAEFGALLMIIDDVRAEWLTGAQLLKQALPSRTSLLLTTRESRLARKLRATIKRVDALNPNEGLNLLRKHAGSAVIEREPEIAIALLADLGYLPLAIKLAGQWLDEFAQKYDPAPIAELKRMIEKKNISALEEELDWLDEEQPGLIATFGLTYEALETEAKRLFRWLSVFSAEVLRLPTVARVAGLKQDRAAELLDQLVKLALLDWSGKSKSDGVFIYTIHPLLKQYAKWLLERSNETETVQKACVDYFLNLVETNNQNTPEAHKRLETELTDLLHAAKLAAQLGQHQVVSQFGLELWEKSQFLSVRGYYRQALELLHEAAQASHQMGDEATEALHFKNIGTIHRSLGNLKEAEKLYRQSWHYFQQTAADNPHYCDLRYHLALCHLIQKNYQEVSNLIQQNLNAAAHFEDITARKRIQAQSYRVLSDVSVGQNNLPQAQADAESSLELFDELNDPQGRAEVLYNLGYILARQGQDLSRARDSYQQCMSYWQETNNLNAQAYTLIEMSRLEQEQQNYVLAFDYLDQAEVLGQKIGDLYTRVATKMYRGVTFAESGNCEAACWEWQLALDLLGEQLPPWQERIKSYRQRYCPDEDAAEESNQNQ